MIIRDTDVAEGIEEEKLEKERDPYKAEENIRVGDFYRKQKNYVGALTRYLTAIEYLPDSTQAYELVDKAYESLVEAYESFDRDPESLMKAEQRHGVLSRAIQALENFIAYNPDSIKNDDFRKMLTKLEQISSEFDNQQ